MTMKPEAICLQHKLIPPGFWDGPPGKSLLLTCLHNPGHDGPHVCGHLSWTESDDIEHLKEKAPNG